MLCQLPALVMVYCMTHVVNPPRREFSRKCGCPRRGFDVSMPMICCRSAGMLVWVCQIGRSGGPVCLVRIVCVCVCVCVCRWVGCWAGARNIQGARPPSRRPPSSLWYRGLIHACLCVCRWVGGWAGTKNIQGGRPPVSKVSLVSGERGRPAKERGGGPA